MEVVKKTARNLKRTLLEQRTFSKVVHRLDYVWCQRYFEDIRGVPGSVDPG
jgi:hypothetical protein